MLGSRFVLAALPVLAVSSLLAVTTVAVAAPTDQDKSLAETLFRDGKALMAAGKYSEACPKLLASEGYDPQLGTLLNLALCHESAGKTASAWAEFSEAASTADKQGQSDRAVFAREHAKALEGKLSRLQVVVTSPPRSLVVKVDGAALATSAWGAAVPVDPGEHAIEASAPGKITNTQKTNVPSKATTTTVTVASLDDAPVGALAPPSPSSGQTTASTADASDGSTLRTLGYIGLGVGVVGVGLGAVFGIETISKKSAANSDGHCNATFCDPTGISDQNASHTDATLSTIAFAGGLTAAALGVVFLIAAPKHDASDSAAGAAKMAWWVAPQGAGIAGGAQF